MQEFPEVVARRRGTHQRRAVVVCRVLRRVGRRDDAPAANAVALDDELRRSTGIARVVSDDAPERRLREREATARREGTSLSRQDEARRAIGAMTSRFAAVTSDE